MSEGITININAASEEASKKLNEFFHGINEKLGELTKAGQFVTGFGEKIIEAFSIAALIEGFNKAVESAEEFGQAVEKTGLSIKALNALRFQAMELPIPIPFGELVNALSMFNDKLYLAVSMGGSAAKMFNDLGIAIQDSTGRARSGEAVLADVMDKFKAMPDGFQKNAAAMQFFSRIGRELIPMFNEGSDAMEKMQHSGGIDEEMIKNAQEFHRAWSQLTEAFQQVFLEASKDIIPLLKDLVGWMGDLEKGTGGEMKASEGMVIAFKALATVIVDLKSVFVILGETIGAKLALEFETFKLALHTLIDLTHEWKNGLSSVVETLKGLGSAMSTARTNIFHDLVGGDFKQAFTDYKTYLGQVKDSAVGVGKDVKQAWGNQFDIIAEGWKKGYSNAKSILGQLGDDITKEATTYTNAINSLWGERKAAAAKAGPGKEGGKTENQTPQTAIVSEEAKRLIEEVDKAYLEATAGKMATLEQRRDKRLEALRRELKDDELFAAEKLKVETTYLKEKQELEDKQQDAKAKRDLETNNIHLSDIKKNPGLTNAEKTKQELPVLQDQVKLLRQIQEVEHERSISADLTPEQRDRAKDNELKATKELLSAEQQLKELQSQNFTGAMRSGLTELQNQWQNLSQNLAGGALNAIKSGVDGIAQGIMGVINHTRTWGQVFAQVGIGIVSNLIQIVVQWIASMTIIAGLKKLLGTQDKTDAAQSAAAWAPAAIAASIASYGSAAVVGTAAYITALFSGTALSTALSGAAGFESGGIIPGGQQYIRVNEKGTEAVLNNKAVRALGPNFINRLNAGIADAYDLANAIPQSLTRPITTDPSFAQSRAGGGGGPVVQGHKLTNIIVNNRQELLEALKSSEGERIISDTVKRRRVDIGINT